MSMWKSCKELLETRKQELQKAVDGEGLFFDALVLTACDAEQKATYEAQIAARVASRVLPSACRYIVVADRTTKNGNRVGCGGATINVLKVLQEQFGSGKRSFPSETRVLLIHSGGYSMRNPNLSTTGKIFAPIPCPVVRGFPVCTLFDLKVALMMPFCSCCGVMVCAGDVLDVFDAAQVQVMEKGVTALAHPDNLEYAALHGVFEMKEEDQSPETSPAADRQVYRVAVYHQKPKADVLKRIADRNFPASAESLRGGAKRVVWTDSDFWMAPDVISAICEHLACWVEAPLGEIDAYGDFLAPLATLAAPQSAPTKSDKKGEEGEEGLGYPAAAPGAPPAARADLRHIWDTLRPFQLHAACPRDHLAFYHIGTMPEYMAHLCSNMGELGFDEAELQKGGGPCPRVAGSTVTDSKLSEECAVFSSFLDGSSVDRNSVVEFSHLKNSEVGSNCIISSVTTEDIQIPPGIVLVTIPLEGGRTTTVCFGVSDDMKAKGVTHVANRKLPRALDSHSLYSAPLFPVLGSLGREEGEVSSRSARITLEHLENGRLGLLDYAWPVESLISLQDAVQGNQGNQGSEARVARVLQRRAPVPGSGLRDHILASARVRLLQTPLQSFQSLRRAAVSLPARVVLSGGWSDTPPFCCLYPGKVVNGAVKVDGKLPITAVVEPNRETELPTSELSLVDGSTGDREQYDSLSSLVTRGFDLDSPLALHRAVVAVLMDFRQSRINRRKRVESVEDVSSISLPPVTMTTRVDLPRGSGLGTSSILMLACIRALCEALGNDSYSFEEEMVQKQEMELVLAVEQLLGTGGGWQDQVGGGCPGMKMTTARTGKYEVQKVDWSEAHRVHFNERLICINTVMTRLAKLTLDSVVDRFMKGSATQVSIISEKLPANARRMHRGFEKFAELSSALLVTEERSPSGEVVAALSEIGDELGVYRDLCVQLDKSFLNQELVPVLEKIDEFCYGRCNLMGAGNGGFIVGLLRHGVSEQELMEKLSAIETVKVELCKIEVI